VSTEIVSRGWALGDYRSFVMEALGAAIEASAGQGCWPDDLPPLWRRWFLDMSAVNSRLDWQRHVNNIFNNGQHVFTFEKGMKKLG